MPLPYRESDHLSLGQSDFNKTVHREAVTECRTLDCHLGQIGTSEPLECSFEALSSCVKFRSLQRSSDWNARGMLSLSHKGFNFDQDHRLPPPQCWNITERSPLQEPSTRYMCFFSLFKCSRPTWCTSSSFLPEERSRNEARQPRPSYPLSLSVFNAPTATYMWPTFQAASQMKHPPVIYVNYNKGHTGSASVSSVSSLHNSPLPNHRHTG